MPSSNLSLQTSFYSKNELLEIGLNQVGDNVLISKKTSIYNPDRIKIGNNVRIDDFCILSGGKEVLIGNYIHIAAFCSLYGACGIVLEDFSGLSSGVTLYTESDDYSGSSLTNPMIPKKFKPKYIKGPIKLSRHVIVGAKSTILPNITLGEGAAVGAHCLVTKDCEPWSIYFGMPAKKISERKKDLLSLEREFLSNSQ